MTTTEKTFAFFGAENSGDAIVNLNKTRADLAALFAHLGYKIGVEVGIETGKYSETLLSSNPGLKLYCVDAWKAYKGYRDHVTQSKIDGFYERTKERLKAYDAVLIRKYSTDAAKDFEDESLDFCYIDANHGYKWVKQDLEAWGRKVKPQGLICGHDYFTPKNNDKTQYGVIQAVNEYVAANNIAPLFILRGDDPKAPSFFFVKP